MDRLALFLTLLSGSAIAGALVVTAFSLGYYNWIVILASVVIGFATAWPTARMVSKRIKTRDPGWKLRDPEGRLPDPKAPEV